jgi:2-polyprenyl-3-methyl-5-hydroxy-6-metoxy-1,4-benzoquinol methylase
MPDELTVSDSSSADRDAIRRFAFQVATIKSGANTAAMMHLGDRLGLYRALAELGEPATSAELAEATGLVERWVREWLYSQGAAHLVETDGERFWLAPHAVPVLVDDEHEMYLAGMFHHLPQTMQRLEALPDSFRTGLGHNYDSHGPELAVGIERSFEPWMRNHLLDDVLQHLDGLSARLTAGARVADVGCGAGGAVLMIAEAFPATHVVGYDISQHALDRARQRQTERGLDNVEFLDARASPIPTDASFDFVTTFDCLHDMTDPAGMMRTVRQALVDDGTWLVADVKAYDTFAENVERNPMAAMMYGDSVLGCMASALSEPGGAGLGTLGLSARRAEAMTREAGFTRFRRLDVDHPVNAFYEIRP